MGKIKYYIIALGSVALAAPRAASAQNLGSAFNNLGKAGKPTGLESDLGSVTGTIIGTALSLVGLIFMILLVYGGYLWMTARGNEDQVKRAQEIIIATVIGLVVVLSAYAITYFVTSRFSG